MYGTVAWFVARTAVAGNYGFGGGVSGCLKLDHTWFLVGFGFWVRGESGIWFTYRGKR
jgi:hypothetical protein